MNNGTMFLTMMLSLLILMSAFSGTANAAGFGEYEGGVLKIEPPRTVKIYKKGSQTSKSIKIGSSEYTVQDARWQGSEVVVTLVERSGKQLFRIYKDTTAFRVVR